MSLSRFSRLRRSPVLWLSPLGLVLVAGAFAAPSCALAAEAEVVIDGEAEVIVEDYDDYAVTRYFVRDNGRRVELKFAGKPADLVTGQKIKVRGRKQDMGGSDGLETLALDGSSSVQTTSTPPLANTLGEQKTIVMLVNFQDLNTQPVSPSSAHSLVFNTAGDFMRENSSQQTWLSGNTVGWFTLPLSKTSCDSSAISSEADKAAIAAGVNLSAYNRKIYMFPNLSVCGWSGLGTVGGNPSRSWINGSFSLRTVAHELGHNYGLRHAYAKDCGSSSTGSSCTTITYGDPVDLMGAAPSAHYGSFNKERLGWLGAGNSPSIATATASGRYYIDGYVSSGLGDRALRVPRGTDATTGKTLWYYLEYRRPTGFDSSLSSSGNLVSGVVVREAKDGDTNSNYFLDMTPNSQSSSSADMRDGALAAGASFTDAVAGVTLSVAWLDSTTAAVDVVMPGGGSSTTCTRTAPTLTIAGGSSSLQAGQGTSFTVSLTNRDSSACSSSSFSLSRSVPSGWSSALGASSLSVSPGATVSTTLSVTASSTAAEGTYAISTGASRSSGEGASASTAITITAPTTTTCTRAAPAFSISGGASSVEAGQGTSYTLSLTNRDSSGCSSSTFSLSRAVPSGWSSALGASSLSASPGATVSTTLSVTTPATTTDGSYGISASASRSSGDGASVGTTLQVTQPAQARKVRVSSIVFSTSKKGPNNRTTATATLVDELGKAVGSTEVTGCFSGADGSCGSDTTTSTGKASFGTGNYRSGTLNFCVTGVSGSGLEFDSTGSCKAL